jgi:5'-nucleotidase
MRPLRSAILIVLVVAAPLAAAERRPRILLSDDDGIAAAGLAALYAELVKVGEVTVAAPAENQSGVGHGVTYQDPIRVSVIDPLVRTEGPARPWYRIVARPATCVRLALTSLLEEKPDLVVSGINRGENAGLVMYVSGTLGAAREAAFDGIPSIAASQVISDKMDYRPGAALVARIAGEVLQRGLPPGVFLSVNLPAGEIKGVRVVPHAMLEGKNAYEKRHSPRGEVYFWNVWDEPVDPTGDTDVGVIGRGYAAVTPLRVDVNDEAARKVLEGWSLR